VAQSSGSKTPGRGKLDSSSLSVAVSGSKNSGRGLRKPKKNKFWNRLKSGLGLGGGSSSGSDGSECLRCGKLIKHKLATFLLSLLLLIYTFFSLIYGFYLVFTEKEEIEKLEKKCRKGWKSDWVKVIWPDHCPDQAKAET